MRHTPASGATVFMLRSLKMHRMAQAVGEPNRESNRNIHEKAGFGERSMNAVIVIPARFQSGRLPGKPMSGACPAITRWSHRTTPLRGLRWPKPQV